MNRLQLEENLGMWMSALEGRERESQKKQDKSVDEVRANGMVKTRGVGAIKLD